MVVLSPEEKNLKLMSQAKNYNRWIYDRLKSYIGDRILEVGGGVGSMTRFFLDKELIVSTDVSDMNISLLKRRFRKKENVIVKKVDISKTTKGLHSYSFDTAVCLNVAEHIKKDIDAFKGMYDVLERSGRLVLLLPAFSCLYGTVDKADSHYRRYDCKEAIKKVERAGFRVIKTSYMNMPGFFGWYYHGRLLKTAVHSSASISFFDRLVPLFAFLERIVRPPFGLSLIVIAEK